MAEVGETTTHAAETEKKPRADQKRCTLATLVNTIADVKESLKPAHMDLPKQTPLYLLIKGAIDNDISIGSRKKLEANTVELMKRYNTENHYIKLNKEEVPLDKSDVRLIFRILDDKEKIEIKNKTQNHQNLSGDFFPEPEGYL